jgi:hypothetical protein
VGKIKPPQFPQGNGQHISAPKFPRDAEIYFSFKLLDLYSNVKFGLRHCGDGYWEKLLVRLRDVCGMRVDDFRGLPTKQVRNHPITFSETSEPDGFKTLNGQLRDKEAWQFEITKSEHGRVHGILIDEVFYVVWIDPCHNLYRKGKGCSH